MKIILTLLICALLLYAGHLMTQVDSGIYVSYKHWEVKCVKSTEEITCNEEPPLTGEKPKVCSGQISVARYCSEYTIVKKPKEE